MNLLIHLKSSSARMARHVLPAPGGEIEARTGFVLKIAHVLKADLPNNIPEEMLNILRNERHPNRLSEIAEPALLYRISQKERGFAELDAMVLNPDATVRNLVLDEISRKLSTTADLCSQQARQNISEMESKARSDRPDDYLRACVSIHDALRSDILYNVALLKQVCSIGDHESALEYINRLLRITPQNLSCFEEQLFIRCFANRPELDELIDSISRSPSLCETLSRYYDVCGFLPLTDGDSCGAVVEKWQTKQQDQILHWKELCDWARSNGSPLAMYQVCQVAVHLQDLITDETSVEIDKEINSIIQGGGKEELSDTWTLRHLLARYYCQYFACEFASGNSERMAICAWWLADRVASALERGSETCREHCLAHIEELLHANEELWLLIQPASEPSLLFSATMQRRRLWAESLTAESVSKLADSGTTKCDVQTVQTMARVALGAAVFSLVGAGKQGYVKYAFEIDVLPFIKTFASCLGETQSGRNLHKIVSLAEKARTKEEIVTSVRELPGLEPDLATPVLFALQRSAFAGGDLFDIVWECINDEAWRQKLINAENTEAFSRFCEVAIRMQSTSRREDWRIRLPHLFATDALKNLATEDRVSMLVGYSVVSCIAGQCTSAISRLFASQNETVISTLEQWHKRLDQIIRFARPLAAARLRPVKQTISSESSATNRLQMP